MRLAILCDRIRGDSVTHMSGGFKGQVYNIIITSDGTSRVGDGSNRLAEAQLWSAMTPTMNAMSRIANKE